MKNDVSTELLLIYLDSEFNKININLTGKQLDSLIQQILTPNNKLTDEQLKYSQYSKEEDFLKILLNKENQLEKFMEKSDEEHRDYSVSLSSKLAKERLEEIYNNVPAYFYELREDSDLVKNSIDSKYSNLLNLLELQISTSIDMTTKFDPSILDSFNENQDLFDALQRLQGRSCLIANEIFVLLKNGFSDGAYARCRTLYETMVISCIISDNECGGNETAKRYLDYSIVNDRKEAEMINEHAEKFNKIKVSNDKLLELDNEIEILKKEYGNSFAVPNTYNWAFKLLRSDKDKIFFKRLEENVEFEHMKVFYKTASNNIHAGSSSLYFHSDLKEELSDNILMGASDFGILKPYDIVSYCINVTTSNLILLITETTEQLVQISLLNQLRKDICQSLNEFE